MGLIKKFQEDINHAGTAEIILECRAGPERERTTGILPGAQSYKGPQGDSNSHENKSGLIQVIMYTASKQIKLESPGCSGFKVW